MKETDNINVNKANRNVISKLIILVVVVILVVFTAYLLGVFKTAPPHPFIIGNISNSTSITLRSAMIAPQIRLFKNSTAFDINYTFFRNSSTSNGSSKFYNIYVTKNGYLLNVTRFSHTIILYYNKTSEKNITGSVPVIYSTYYNSTGMLNCNNNPIIFQPSTGQVYPNESGFYSLSCSFSRFTTSNTSRIDADEYYNVFVSKVLMLNLTDSKLLASNLSNTGIRVYDGINCSFYSIKYQLNNYNVCFSTEYGIPIYANMTVKSINLPRNVIILGKFFNLS